MTISRGVFSKGLGFQELTSSLVPLALTVPALIAIGTLLLKKQES